MVHETWHDGGEPNGNEIGEVANVRWPAADAFMFAPGLTAMARRVGYTLISAMDKKDRTCFISELVMASRLGVNIVSVKKAKAELKEVGLINWTNPHGPRHQCVYAFNWGELQRIAQEAKERGRAAIAEAHIKRRQRSPQATMETGRPRSQGSPQDFQGSQKSPQGSLQATPKVAPRLPEQPLEQPLSRTALIYHAVLANGGVT